MTKIEQNIGGIISYFAIVLLLFFIAFSIVGFESEMILLVVLGTITTSAFLFCFIVFKILRNSSKFSEIDYLNTGTQRYILSMFMIFYGIPKIFGTFFDYQLFALDSKLVNISDFELAWFYFGKNKWHELFAGIMELVPAILLLNRRTYFIGALILLPVTSNVFILNLFFKIGGITLPTATILLLCNIYLLYYHKEKIIQILKSINYNQSLHLNRFTNLFIKVAKGTTIIIITYIIYNNCKPIFYKSQEQLIYEKLVGAYSLENALKNKNSCEPTNSLLYKDLFIEKQSRWNVLRRGNDETEAFIIDLDSKSDSIKIFINKNGIGDGKASVDSSTVLKGTYKIDQHSLLINGVQLKDTLVLKYSKRTDLKPKKWFW